ncbi:PPOX class F420-dependent oxidoreductase [Pseudofrankia inefficax]|uniref:Putative F420-dependent enzyme n=1 Tax=Pseudofrankia inefficax (strain DSM 45817 / CECT 9037 / DDB 130130 / EuI1c) TaxID=298654 RepID=E3J9Y5_PSEI1|nr:PPOX class F420-dependent oxidoreductase [Pseudofrankia inefficax]ADP78547.1 putative F420-dependent enzyme [Pseudofrankia inefficax]
MAISDEKYVAVTTFRKNSVGVSTPTWIVPLDDGRVGFWTSSASGKYKRLRNNPRVTVQPSDNRGRVKADTTPVDGTAELAQAGPDFDAIQTKVRSKYGVMVHITKFFNTVGHLGKGPFPYGDTGIVITLAVPAPSPETAAGPE